MKYKLLFAMIFLMIFLSSCSVMSIEPYRSADTLGPLHFRIGISGQGGFLGYSSMNNDTISNVGTIWPVASGFAGIGILNNLDLYGSVSVPLLSMPVYGVGLKYKFIDKLGFKAAVIPTFKINNQDDVVILGDTVSFKTYGVEMPIIATYSVLNFLLLTGGVHTGYYSFSTTRAGGYSYDFYSYGFTLMPEIKFFKLRLSLGCDIRFYGSFKQHIVYDENLAFYQKHLNPFLNISFQF